VSLFIRRSCRAPPATRRCAIVSELASWLDRTRARRCLCDRIETTLAPEDAQALVALIAADATPFTVRLAAKINRSLLDGNEAEEVELERDELAEIADALSVDPKLVFEVPALKPLYDEVVAALQD